MKIEELLEKLAQQGIHTTEQELVESINDIDLLTDDDIPVLVEMLGGVSEGSSKPAKRSKSGNIDKSKSGSIAKLDINNLPQVSNLSNAEVGAYIDQLEQMDAGGQSLNDEAIGFLLALYDRRKEAIEFARNAVQSFKAQDRELASVRAELDETVNDSVQTLQSFNSLMQQFSNGGARLGDRFRSNTTNMRAAANRFNSHVAAQSSNQAESAA